MQEKGIEFLNDSPFLKNEMETYYKKNNDLHNVLLPDTKKKEKKKAIMTHVRNLSIAGVAIGAVGIIFAIQKLNGGYF